MNQNRYATATAAVMPIAENISRLVQRIVEQARELLINYGMVLQSTTDSSQGHNSPPKKAEWTLVTRKNCRTHKESIFNPNERNAKEVTTIGKGKRVPNEPVYSSATTHGGDAHRSEDLDKKIQEPMCNRNQTQRGTKDGCANYAQRNGNIKGKVQKRPNKRGKKQMQRGIPAQFKSLKPALGSQSVAEDVLEEGWTRVTRKNWTTHKESVRKPLVEESGWILVTRKNRTTHK
ncbi:hypothetical protein CVT24_006023 [Panaeolus cyanescens]|uniref:Uncharacterized protein n=1 Tax=Panaeolus cyanescens TaxID=181874 RepID=A0A409YE08_9AGAR|nr:hypothetical protein CVT24_006023 [Panaeolus cyanescens]